VVAEVVARLERHADERLGMVGAGTRDAGGDHVAVADRLDLLEPVSLDQGIEIGEDRVEELDQLDRRHGGRERREADEVGEEDADVVVVVGDVAGGVLQDRGHFRRQDIQEEVLGLRTLGPDQTARGDVLGDEVVHREEDEEREGDHVAGEEEGSDVGREAISREARRLEEGDQHDLHEVRDKPRDRMTGRKADERAGDDPQAPQVDALRRSEPAQQNRLDCEQDRAERQHDDAEDVEPAIGSRVEPEVEKVRKGEPDPEPAGQPLPAQHQDRAEEEEDDGVPGEDRDREPRLARAEPAAVFGVDADADHERGEPARE